MVEYALNRPINRTSMMGILSLEIDESHSNPRVGKAVPVSLSRERGIKCSILVDGQRLRQRSKHNLARILILPNCYTQYSTRDMEKRVFITGAAGFLGSHLLHAFKSQSTTAIGVDNFEAPRHSWQPDNPEVKKVDVCDRDQLGRAIDQFEPTHLVHLASHTNVLQSIEAPRRCAEVNIQGFLNVIEVCNARSIRLLYASSAMAKEPVKNLYGATKRTNEVLAQAYATSHGLVATALRFFTVYGPRGRPDMAYFRFAEAMMAHRPITLYGEGAVARDFLYIEDAIGATVAALALDKGHHILELGRGMPTPMREIVAILERRLNRPACLLFAPLPRWDILETRADVLAAQQLLGWTAKTEPTTGLGLFADWWEQVVQTPSRDGP